MTDEQTERYVVAMETQAEALKSIASSLSAGATLITAAAQSSGDQNEVKSGKDKKATTKKAAKKAAKKTAKTKEPTDEGKTEPTDEHSAVSIGDLTALARKLVREGGDKKKAVVDMVQARGIGKVSNTPEEDWEEVLEELQAIDDGE